METDPQGRPHPDQWEELWIKLYNAAHPRVGIFNSYFTFISVFISISIFGAALLLSSPLLSDWWGCYISSNIKEHVSIETAKHTCDWLAVLLQVFIFTAIGGIVFTETLSRKIKDAFERFQLSSIEHIKSTEEARIERARQTFKTLENTLAIKGGYAKKTRLIVGTLIGLGMDARFASNRMIWFAARGVLLSFPGGLYGFVTFALITLQIVSISLKITLDYLPLSCKW